MAKDNAEDKAKKEERKRNSKAYTERLTVLRHAQEYSQKGDIPKAVERYSTYLNILARYFEIEETQLSPKYFNAERDITELLLISHAYWDLAKAYDRSPKLIGEAKRCINQFVKFSVGFKFQHVNAQMMRKFIRQKQAYNLPLFKEAYERIRIDSKGCFVASYTFDSDHEVTNRLRNFRDKTVNLYFFKKAYNFYYDISPSLVNFLKQTPLIGKPLKILIFKPTLKLINGFLKLCSF